MVEAVTATAAAAAQDCHYIKKMDNKSYLCNNPFEPGRRKVREEMDYFADLHLLGSFVFLRLLSKSRDYSLQSTTRKRYRRVRGKKRGKRPHFLNITRFFFYSIIFKKLYKF